jgi:hypothetical protein
MEAGGQTLTIPLRPEFFRYHAAIQWLESQTALLSFFEVAEERR